MSNYNGMKCISCGNVFKDGDDVVVCPECGTPYHRECYLKEGKCVNTKLHETGESWKPEFENTENAGNSGEPLRCIRCGAVNPPEGIFCNKCGMPLNANRDAQRPFNSMNDNVNGFNNNNQNGFFSNQQGTFPFGGTNQMVFDKDSEIDGVKLDDYSKYVGKNQFSFLSQFIRFGKFGGKVSMNLGALVFPELYFFYRKMKKVGILFLALTFILSIPEMIVVGQTSVMGMTLLGTNINVNSADFKYLYTACSYLIMGLRFLAGLFGTYWYYRTARKDIMDIRQKNSGKDETIIKEQISAKGGTSWIYVIVAATVFFVIIAFSYVGMNYLL